MLPVNVKESPFSRLGRTRKWEVLSALKKVLEKETHGRDLSQIIPCLVTFMKFGNEIQLEGNQVFEQVINNIVTLHNKASSEFRPALRALVTPEVSYPNLVSPDQYRYAKKKKANGTFTLMPFKRFNPKEKKTVADIKLVLKTCLLFLEIGREPYGKELDDIYKEISQQNDNEFCCHTTYNLNLTRAQIFSVLVATYPNLEIGESTYYRYIPPNFKFPTKRTDVCGLCLDGSLLETWYTRGSNDPEISDPSIRDTLEALKNNRRIISIQKTAFEDSVNKLKDESCIIITDFKENIEIGGSLEEPNQVFWSKAAISVLGFAVIYRKEGILT